MAARTVIQSIGVEGTGFLAPFEIELSSGLNCIIGARGTGKTSLLELIRYAAGREADTDAVEQSVSRLIPAALGEGGHVRLRVRTQFGQEVVITRSVDGPWSAIDSSTQEPANIDWPALGVHDLAIFSQNQLEDIATSPSGRLATLDSFCGAEVERIRADIRDAQQRLGVNAAQQVQLSNEIAALRTQSEALPKLEADLASINTQFEKALLDLQGQEPIKKKIQELGDLRQSLLQEDTVVGGLLSEAEAALLEPFPGRALGDVLRRGLAEDTIAPLPDRDRLRQLRGDVSNLSQRYAQLRAEMFDALTRVRDAISETRIELAARLAQVNTEYQSDSRVLGALSQAWKDVAARRDVLLSQVRTLQSARLGIEQRQQQLGVLYTERQELLVRLNALLEDRFDLRRSAASQLNAAMGGNVLVEVVQGGSPERYEQFLLQALRGSGMWYSRLAAAIVSKVPPSRLAEMVRLGETTALAGAVSIDDERARRVLSVLDAANSSFDLEALDAEDAVVFSLRVSANDYRQSEALSQGQKCTTVLSLMLVDSANPLIIDQPEDNLDNSYVVDTIVDVISRQRPGRQFIFVTHNPNLPVLGESELVACMQATDGKGSPGATGPWDRVDIMDRIISVMEGGLEAFRRRHRAYGADARLDAAG